MATRRNGSRLCSRSRPSSSLLARATIYVPLTKRGRQMVKASGKRGLKVTLTGSGIKHRPLILKSSS